MLYLLQALPEWSIGALVLGLFAGLFAPRAGSSASWIIWSVVVSVLFIAGAVAAALSWLPGRYGFWLETALLLLTVYFASYAYACLVRRLFGSLVRRLFGGSKASREAPEFASPAPAESFVAAAPALEMPANVSKSPPRAVPRPAPAPDDLLHIHGMDEKISQVLRDLGIRRFTQLAALTPVQENGVAARLPDCGPEARKYWVAQAQLLAGGVVTDFSRPAPGEPNDVSSRATPLDEVAARALRDSLPQLISPHVHDGLYAGLRPLSLLQPPQGERDDLTKIAGIDPPTEERLNALGAWTYAQIARWSDQNVRWIGSYLAFPGRVEREKWVEQAQALTRGKNVCA